jgi:hypothetical protein
MSDIVAGHLCRDVQDHLLTYCCHTILTMYLNFCNTFFTVLHLLLHCRYTAVPVLLLLLRCRYTVVTLLLHCCRTTVRTRPSWTLEHYTRYSTITLTP